jgi:hypothetical protein
MTRSGVAAIGVRHRLTHREDFARPVAAGPVRPASDFAQFLTQGTHRRRRSAASRRRRDKTRPVGTRAWLNYSGRVLAHPGQLGHLAQGGSPRLRETSLPWSTAPAAATAAEATRRAHVRFFGFFFPWVSKVFVPHLTFALRSRTGRPG